MNKSALIKGKEAWIGWIKRMYQEGRTVSKRMPYSLQ